MHIWCALTKTKFSFDLNVKYASHACKFQLPLKWIESKTLQLFGSSSAYIISSPHFLFFQPILLFRICSFMPPRMKTKLFATRFLFISKSSFIPMVNSVQLCWWISNFKTSNVRTTLQYIFPRRGKACSSLLFFLSLSLK